MALLECKDSVSRDTSRDVTQQNKIKNKNYSLYKKILLKNKISSVDTLVNNSKS